MCGIIVAHSYNREKFNPLGRVWDQFRKQFRRGTEGFGFVAVKDDELIFVRTKTERDILEEMEKLDYADLVLFHHRIPTSSVNTPVANHPILIHNEENLDYDYYLIHNGHISNHLSVKEKLSKNGWKFSSEYTYFKSDPSVTYKEITDSEILGIDLALYIESPERKISDLMSYGGVACFLLQVDPKTQKPLNLFYFKNTNPIKYYRNKDGLLMGSAVGGEDVKDDVLYRYELETKRLFTEPFKYPKYYSELGNDTNEWKEGGEVIIGDNEESSVETLAQAELESDLANDEFDPQQYPELQALYADRVKLKEEIAELQLTIQQYDLMPDEGAYVGLLKDDLKKSFKQMVDLNERIKDEEERIMNVLIGSA